MRIATTCNKEGFDAYGYRLLESWKLWPRDAELWWYCEGFKVEGDGIKCIPIEYIQDLENLKRKYKYYVPNSYLYDVVRFANKAFAAIECFYGWDGLACWMDADCVTFKPVTEELIRSQLPSQHYMAMYKRAGMYTETGFWIMDCSHIQNKAFLDTWADWYRTDSFKTLPNYTDCETLDATVRLFERNRLLKTASLSGAYEKEMHPMSSSKIGEHCDHLKGGRKVAGVSPENKFHQAAIEAVHATPVG